MIDVERLTKHFGTHVALSEVTFHVPQGSVVGLLGKNGAGKSTTLRILSGASRPTSGRIRLDGVDTQDKPIQTRQQVGYLAESAPLYPELRVEEHLRFRAAQKGLTGARKRERISRTLDAVDAHPWRDVLCGQLSRGMRQRVGLADALLNEPRVLLLDEPTAGLDPSQTRETRDLIRGFGESCTVIVSTHILAEVDAMCDSAIVIDEGRVVAQGSLSTLYALGQSSALSLTLRADVTHARAALEHFPDATIEVEPIAPDILRAIVTPPMSEALETFAEAVVAQLVSVGIGVQEVTRRRATLEQVFSALTLKEERP